MACKVLLISYLALSGFCTIKTEWLFSVCLSNLSVLTSALDQDMRTIYIYVVKQMFCLIKVRSFTVQLRVSVRAVSVKSDQTAPRNWLSRVNVDTIKSYALVSI